MTESYKPFHVTPEDKASWTVAPVAKGVLCTCIGTGLFTGIVNGKPTYSFILKLVENDTGEEITCYISYNKTKKGKSVSRIKSKFATLYRLTTGENPTSRFSKAQQLVKHFIGREFIVDYAEVQSAKQGAYRKASSIEAAHPIVTDDWTKKGVLKGKKRGAYKSRNWKLTGNLLETSWKLSGNLVETEKAETPHFYLASPNISTSPISLPALQLAHLKASAVDGKDSAVVAPVVSVAKQEAKEEKKKRAISKQP